MRINHPNEQPKPPEGFEIKKPGIKVPAPFQPRQLLMMKQYCKHLNTKLNYTRKFIKKIRSGPKPMLTDEDVIKARLMAKEMTLKEIAHEFGVSYQTIKNAVKGYTFQHLNFVCPPKL